MSAIISNSSQTWPQLRRIAQRRGIEFPVSPSTIFRDNVISFSSLVTLVATITYLLLR